MPRPRRRVIESYRSMINYIDRMSTCTMKQQDMLESKLPLLEVLKNLITNFQK